MNVNADPRFSSLSSLRAALSSANLSTKTPPTVTGDARYQMLAARLTSFLTESGEIAINPTTRLFESKPITSKPSPAKQYNLRVSASLTITELKGRLEVLGVTASTVDSQGANVRGDERHMMLLMRLSEVYDEEDGASDGSMDSVANEGDDDEKHPYVKRQYFPAATEEPKKAVFKANPAAFSSPAPQLSTTTPFDPPPPRDWASTASYNDNYDPISDPKPPNEEEDDSNNKYAGFDRYGKAYRDRTHQKNNTMRSREASPRDRDLGDLSPKQSPRGGASDTSGMDYVDLISDHFNLSALANPPEPILRRPLSSGRPKTSDRVKFNEPVEPYVPLSEREPPSQPRATLHTHAVNEPLRQQQQQQEQEQEQQSSHERKQQDQTRDVYQQQQSVNRKKMEQLKSRLGPAAAPPKSPKPKKMQSAPAFSQSPDSLPPVAAASSRPSSSTSRLSSSDTSSSSSLKSKLSKKIARLIKRQKGMKQTRASAIEARLDSRSPMQDPQLAEVDKAVTQHGVEHTRISTQASKSATTLTSSILVDGGRRKIPAKDLAKILKDRTQQYKKELVIEQQRVRAEELDSAAHGKQVEDELGEKIRRYQAMDVGVGNVSESESEEESASPAPAQRRSPRDAMPPIVPVSPASPVSPTPANTLVLGGKMDLAPPDQLLELPASINKIAGGNNGSPPAHNPLNPVKKRAPPPKVSEADRLGCEALRLQSADAEQARECYEGSMELEPENIKTLCNYSLFCHKIMKRMDDAEALFKRGTIISELWLETKEEEEEGGAATLAAWEKRNSVVISAAASLLSNYGNFLKSVRGFSSSAEEMHQKAIRLSEKHVGALGNYAKFKMESKHDFASAEELFKKALDIDAEHGGNLTSYARMLKKMGRFDQAEGIYKRAMESEQFSGNVIMLCNYANFLKKVRGDMAQAKELYEKGLQMNPTAPYLLKNYGIFMRDWEKGGGVGVGVGGGMFKKKEKEAEIPSRDEVDSEVEEGEEEDEFEADHKIPAHLLTNKRDPSQMPVEVGGDGWVKYRHPQYGIYYYNEITNDSVYDEPEGWGVSQHAFAQKRTQAAAEEEDEDDEEEEGTDDEEEAPKPGLGETPAELMEDAWARFVDPNSKLTYFYNMATGLSQYERPNAFTSEANPFGGAREGEKEDADILSSRRGAEEKPKEVLGNGEWVRYTDEETGFTYFYNNLTGQSQYERPDAFSTGVNAFASVRKQLHVEKEDADILNSRRGAGEKAKEVLNGGWCRYRDEESGSDYYWNEESKTSQYERPSGFSTVQDAFASVRGAKPDADILSSRRGAEEKAKEVLNGGWVRYRDEESKYDYYFHEESETSQYERPDGFSTTQDAFASVRGGKKPEADILSSRRGAEEEVKEVLNGGWVRYRDEESGYDYYWHEESETSTYDRPDGFSTTQDAFASLRKGKKPEADILSSRRGVEEKVKEVLNGGWVRYRDEESGHDYYFHEESETSQYERPDGFSTTQDAFASVRKKAPDVDILSSKRDVDAVPVEVLNGGWQKFKDEESGYEYYWHEDSETSTYDRPEGFETVNDAFAAIRRSKEVGERMAALNKAGGSGREKKEDADVLAGRREEDAVAEEFLNGGWCKYKDEETGQFYYFNEALGESCYDRPESFQTYQNPFGDLR